MKPLGRAALIVGLAGALLAGSAHADTPLVASNLASTDTLTLAATNDTTVVAAETRAHAVNIQNKSSTLTLAFKMVFNSAGSDTVRLTVDPLTFAHYEFPYLTKLIIYKPAAGSLPVRRWVEVSK